MEFLNNPPIAVAILQLKYEDNSVKVANFMKYDAVLKRILPKIHSNINVGLSLNKTSIPLGVSQISARSDAKIDACVYMSADQKKRLEISKDTISYVDESKYTNWAAFKKSGIDLLMKISEELKNSMIKRLSIRYINKFNFPDFDKPQDYLNTIITTANNTNLPYPLSNYGFRLRMDIPNSNIYSIVNQNIEDVGDKSYLYVLDIDVLDDQNLSFDIQTISDNLEILRTIKNKIFFDAITAKTKALCD